MTRQTSIKPLHTSLVIQRPGHQGALLSRKKKQRKRRSRDIQVVTGADETKLIGEGQNALSDEVNSALRPRSFLDALFLLESTERYFFSQSHSRVESASLPLTLPTSPSPTALSDGSPSILSLCSPSSSSPSSSSVPPSPTPLSLNLEKSGKSSDRYTYATIPTKRKFRGPWSPVPLHADLFKNRKLGDEASDGETGDDGLSHEEENTKLSDGELRRSSTISDQSPSLEPRNPDSSSTSFDEVADISDGEVSASTIEHEDNENEDKDETSTPMYILQPNTTELSPTSPYPCSVCNASPFAALSSSTQSPCAYGPRAWDATDASRGETSKLVKDISHRRPVPPLSSRFHESCCCASGEASQGTLPGFDGLVSPLFDELGVNTHQGDSVTGLSHEKQGSELPSDQDQCANNFVDWTSADDVVGDDSDQVEDPTWEHVQALIPFHHDGDVGTSQTNASLRSEILAQYESPEESVLNEDFFPSQPSNIIQTPLASQEDLGMSSERRYNFRSVSSSSQTPLASRKSGTTWFTCLAQNS